MDAAAAAPPEPTFLRLRMRDYTGAPTADDLIVETEDGQQVRGVRDVVLRIDEAGYLVVDLRVAMDVDLRAQLEGVALEPLSTRASLEKVAEQRNAARDAVKTLRQSLQQAALDLERMRQGVVLESKKGP
jgi:hypothetical protein